MNRLSLTINFLLLALVGALYAYIFVGKPNTVAKTETTLDIAMPMPTPVTVVADSNGKTLGHSIVWVNTDSLLKKYDYYIVAKVDMESKSKKASQDMQSRVASLENAVTAARQKAQSMTQAQMQETEQTLMQQQQALGTYKNQMEDKLAGEERKLTEKLNNNIKAFLKDYAAAGHYQYVLSYTGTGGLLFADASLDVTADVVKGLNARYKLGGK